GAPSVQGVEGEQGQWALAPLSVDWEAKLEPGVTSCSEALERGGKVIHVAELESRLPSMADEASDEGSEGADGRARREHLPRETERDGPPEPRGVGEGEGEEAELIEVASMGVVDVDSEAELIEASLGVVDVGSGEASEGEVVAGGSDWLAPGVWQTRDHVEEAEAFAEGLAAGWRLAGRGGAAAESSEAAPTAAVAVSQALWWRQRRRQKEDPSVLEEPCVRGDTAVSRPEGRAGRRSQHIDLGVTAPRQVLRPESCLVAGSAGGSGGREKTNPHGRSC
ncbi:unnamed protein product, partial [Prorocentrum cordatum]